MKVQQVEFGGAAQKAGKDGVSLSAMVSLVIEPMREGRPQGVNNFIGCRDTPIFDLARECVFIERLNVGDNASIFRFAREKNGVQAAS